MDYNGALDFHDGENANCEYEYDSNGALTRDGNRGINSITYDYGHHTYKINLDVNNRPRYIVSDYTPDGRKLLSRHVTSIPKPNGYTKKTTIDMYVDGLILRGGSPLLWQFGGGYVDLDANGTPTCWNYYITDHLGSTRMVVSSNDSIRETINYYPFGSEMRMDPPALPTGDTSHPFRFTGKELDRLNSLNMYDFGALWYDVAGVPMWTSIDPLCEKYYNVSPYAYCGNNPVNAIDIKGDSITMDYESIMAIYNGLEDGSHINMEFNNGILDPSSISKAAKSTSDFFLQDLYEIACNPNMVELCTSTKNKYIMNGQEESQEWNAPYEDNDYDLAPSVLSFLKTSHLPIGRHIQGNTGQSLFPNFGLKRSTNNNIQININGAGNNINAQSIGIAHEFGHVLLYLRGLPSGHGQSGVDDFVYGRATLMSKRLGYDY